MGCNCKQTQTTKKPSIIRINDVNEIKNLDEPRFTQQDLDRAKQYFISRQQTQEEKNWVLEFHNTHFGEKFPENYTGDGWLRIKKRLDHLQSVLDTYRDNKNN